VLSLDQLAAVVWRRKVTFIVTFLLVMVGAAVAISLMTKVYSTSAYLYVSGGKNAGSDYEQVQINQVVSKTFAELLQTRNVANDVAAALPWKESGQGVLNSVSVTPVESTQLITLNAEASSAERAQTLANTYAQVFIDQAGKVLGDTSSATQVRLAERAPLITNQARPRPKLYMLIAAIIGLILATGAALLRHRTDQRLELDDTSTELNGLPLIGRVSAGTAGELPLHAEIDDLSERGRRAQEEYRLLLANLSFVNHGRRPRTLAVVSSGQGEGKSTTTVSIGRAAVEMGVRTLLVDGDLRRPRLSQAVAREAGPSAGLSSFLTSPDPLAISEVAVDLGGLSVIPSGPVPVNPTALLGSDEFIEFVERAGKIYDLVIFDTPPLAVGADASLMCANVEGVLLVIDARSTRRTPLMRAIDQLTRAKANVLGIVVNRATQETTPYYYDANHTGGGDDGRRRRETVSAADES